MVIRLKPEDLFKDAKNLQEVALKELEKGNVKREDLTSVAIDTPFEILYAVFGENVEGCSCEVAAYPLLSGLPETLIAEFDETEIQSILASCSQRLVRIFVDGLKGKDIT